MPDRKAGTREKYWIAAAILLTASWLSIGCSPTSLNFLLMPWVDDRIPPKCKLAPAEKDGEVTVAVLANFAGVETNLELMPADTQLAELFTLHLRKRCAENKEKVRFVPQTRVKNLLSQNAGNTLSLQQIGKKLKADYVIGLEINSISLFERGSTMLLRGKTEIAVTACDVHKAREEATVFQEIYRCEYPRMRTFDVNETSPLDFRTKFLIKVASDLSRNFTFYRPEELRRDMD
jgi:hypothetical protein